MALALTVKENEIIELGKVVKIFWRKMPGRNNIKIYFEGPREVSIDRTGEFDTAQRSKWVRNPKSRNNY